MAEEYIGGEGEGQMRVAWRQWAAWKKRRGTVIRLRVSGREQYEGCADVRVLSRRE